MINRLTVVDKFVIILSYSIIKASESGNSDIGKVLILALLD